MQPVQDLFRSQNRCPEQHSRQSVITSASAPSQSSVLVSIPLQKPLLLVSHHLTQFHPRRILGFQPLISIGTTNGSQIRVGTSASCIRHINGRLGFISVFLFIHQNNIRGVIAISAQISMFSVSHVAYDCGGVVQAATGKYLTAAT